MLKFISRVYLTQKEYELMETRLDYKVFNELKKHISVKKIMYNAEAKVNVVDENIIMLQLPFKPNLLIKKILAYIYIHYKFFYMIKNERENIFVIGITSKLFNILLVPFAIYRNRILVQLYTPSVVKNRWKRILLDNFTKFILKLFENYLITGDNRTKQVYKLKDEKCLYIKLGMPVYGNKKELQKDKLRLLYIGTLNNREIHKIVIGIRKFVDTYNIPIVFNICGFGNEDKIKKLKEIINDNKLADIVKYHGFVSYKEFTKFIEISNIGVSYVPNVPKYNGVSITKTVEYMLAGLPVIGTKNSFNSETINHFNGMLCDDNPESFCHTIKQIWDKFDAYKPDKIKETVKEYSMQSCIEEGYLPVVRKIAKEQNCEL